MLNKHPKDIQDRLIELFNQPGKESAKLFLLGYGAYIELADDTVDETPSIARHQQLTSLAAQIYSCDYWQKNREKLLMIELINNLTYFDIVKWERSGVEWKERDAKALSHYGYNMLFAVMILEFGFEVTREFSAQFRESCHLMHLNDPKVC